MGHEQIGKDEAAAHAATEREATAAYEAAYADAKYQFEEDGDHAAFSARCKAILDTYKAAVAPVWERRAGIVERIDED